MTANPKDVCTDSIVGLSVMLTFLLEISRGVGGVRHWFVSFQNSFLASPPASAAQPMPDGSKPVPGGWNRFVFEVKNLQDLVAKLKKLNVKFRNEILKGPGGSQILCEDPSGNVIELFEPAS